MGQPNSTANLACLLRCQCIDGNRKTLRPDIHADLYDGSVFESACLSVLICDLEEELHKWSGRILAKDFSTFWRQCAECRAGKLSKLELETIKASTEVFLQVVPVDHSGMVDVSKLSLYLLSEPEPRCIKALRARLQAMSQRRFDKLSAVFRLLNQYDHDYAGAVSSTELGLCLMELAPTMQMPEAIMIEATTEVVRRVEFDYEGKTDLWEALGLLFGRRAISVEILLYDLSAGASDAFSELLLGQHFEAVYHTSVLAFGGEYWYGGQIYKASPPQSRNFGTPLSTSVTELKPSAYDANLQSVHIGFTLATCAEFKLWLTDAALRFNVESYDVLNYNCNNFSEEAAQFLTGRSIPDSIRQMPKLMMGTVEKMPVLRPLLNKWLGGVERGLEPETAKAVEPLKLPQTVEFIGHCKVTTLVDENGRCVSTI